MATNVKRVGDMSRRASLEVFRQDDGDVIVQVLPDPDDPWSTFGASVEFCMPMSGGGRSPKTLAALNRLMDAIKEDNADSPIDCGDEYHQPKHRLTFLSELQAHVKELQEDLEKADARVISLQEYSERLVNRVQALRAERDNLVSQLIVKNGRPTL